MENVRKSFKSVHDDEDNHVSQEQHSARSGGTQDVSGDSAVCCKTLTEPQFCFMSTE